MRLVGPALAWLLALSCAGPLREAPPEAARPVAATPTAPAQPTRPASPSPGPAGPSPVGGSPIAPRPELLPKGPELPVEVEPSPLPTDLRYQDRRFMTELTVWQRGVRDRQVLRAMLAVPRHEFVPSDHQGLAYADHPLPIGYGQTISQPYIVALMTDLLELEPDDRVLEVGTGSGYQAAVLAEIAAEVYSIEIIPQLASSAAERLERLGYDARVRRGDGYLGWPEAAPFDAIIVTAAPDHIPPPLVAQLADGGVMAIPVGPPGGYQSLWRLEKRDGQVTTEFVTGVRFVPLLREAPGE